MRLSESQREDLQKEMLEVALMIKSIHDAPLFVFKIFAKKEALKLVKIIETQ